ncbi:MAG TPA: M20/M25/M40 family metallo-hydrolase [Gemmatimonadaceae bacterium]
MSFRFVAAAAALTLAACHSTAVSPRASLQPDSLAIRRDVEHLASPALAGRLTGTPGNDSAAAYIARRYAALGLREGVPGYLQRFVARANVRNAATLPTQNVVAILPGRDPELASQYVVVGAHLDHLGASTEFANDPEARDALRRGADDNASGSAAVLELARLFAASPTRRSIVFVNFSGEEQGLLGSQYFADHSPAALDKVDAMINFDMVGRLKNDRLLIAGVGTANELQTVLDSANSAVGLKIATSRDGWGRSDHASFTAKDIPVLHFFTDVHEDYHRATDVPEKINASGEARVVALAERVIRDVANRPARLTFVRIAQPALVGGGRTGVYFGSIPDMAGSDTPGLRLQGVTAGSPADRAGIKAGDVVVEFAGKAVKDLNDYSEALYGHKPDDEVTVVVLRDGRRMTFTVKLGKRG